MRNRALDTQSSDTEVVVFMFLQNGASVQNGRCAEGMQRAGLNAWAQGAPPFLSSTGGRYQPHKMAGSYLPVLYLPLFFYEQMMLLGSTLHVTSYSFKALQCRLLQGSAAVRFFSTVSF